MDEDERLSFLINTAVDEMQNALTAIRTTTNYGELTVTDKRRLLARLRVPRETIFSVARSVAP